MRVKDFYVRQSEKAGTPTPPAFVWVPLKSSTTADYLWFNYHPSITAYGETTDAWGASSDIQEVVARFNAVSTCQSALFEQTDIYAGAEGLGDGPFYITSAACNFNHGWDMDDMDDLRAHAAGYLGNAGTHESYILFQRVMVAAGPTAPDIRITAVHNSASEWASRQESIAASEGGQMLMRHFQGALDCSVSHWSSTNMVPFPEELTLSGLNEG